MSESQAIESMQGITSTKRIRASRKQDPSWAELFTLMIGESENATRRLKHPHYLALNQELIELVESILRHPPTMQDIDDDVIAIIVRRLHRESSDTGKIRNRINRLRELAAFATARYNHPAVDFDAIPLARRLSFKELEPERQPAELPSDATPGQPAMIPLDTLLDDYIRERLVGKSPETTRLMRVAVKAYSKWLGRSAIAGDLNRRTVLDYIANMIESDRLARASIQTHLERILALWRFAARKRITPDFPDIQKVHVPARTPDAWRRDELVALVETIRKQQGNFGAVPKSLYWEALISFIYDTGERITAVLAVRFDDIRDDWVTVRAELRKGKTRDKAYRLRPATIELIGRLRECVGNDRKPIFEWHLNRTYLWKLFGDLLKAAGLPDGRRNKFHRIRRTVASEFEAAGGNATELLDHDSRRTTKRSYLDPSVIKAVQPADIVGGIGEELPSTPPPVSPSDAELLSKLRGLLGGQS